MFLLAYWLSFFYRSTNAVIADDLARDVGLGPGALGLMTSLFFLGIAAVQLPLGAALDRFGARIVTASLLLVTVTGSLVFASATSLTALAVGRTLMGVGMAGILMGALKVFAAWFDTRRFAIVSSTFVGVGSLGALLAATPLAWFTEAFGWRAAFVWGAGLVFLAALAIGLVARVPNDAAPRTVQPSRHVGFAAVFRDTTFWRLAIVVFAVKGGLFAWQGLWMGPFLMQGFGLSVVDTGHVLLSMGIGAAAGFVASGAVAARLGVGRTLAFGCAGFLLSVTSLLLATPTWPLAAFHAVAAAMGATGATSVLAYARVREAFPDIPGHAVTAANLFGIGGGALLQWGLGALIGAFTPSAGAVPTVFAFNVAICATALLAGLALAVFAPIAGRPVARTETA